MLGLRAHRLLARRAPPCTSMIVSARGTAAAAAAIGLVPKCRAFSTTAVAGSSTTAAVPATAANTVTKRASPSSSSGAVATPLPPLIRRLYRSLLRISGEFDRLPTLKAALLHPGADEVNAAADQLDAYWREARHQAIRAIAQQERDRVANEVRSKETRKELDAILVARPSESAKGADTTKGPTAVDATTTGAAAVPVVSKAAEPKPREFTRMLMAYHDKHAPEPFGPDVEPDDLDHSFEVRAREKFFARRHGPAASLSDRFYWKTVDRFFRRRRIDWIIDQANDQPRLMGATDQLPQQATDLIASTAGATPATTATDAAPAPSTAASSSSSPATLAVAPKASPAFTSISPSDPAGTYTPEHYMPSRSMAAHVRREFRIITRTPSPKQYEAITQALFSLLKYLNGEKLSDEPQITNGSVEETARARTWMTRLISESLPPSVLERDPSHFFDPILRTARLPPADDVDAMADMLDEQWETDLDALLADDAHAEQLALAAKQPSQLAATTSSDPSTSATPTELASSLTSTAPTTSSVAASAPASLATPPHWALRSTRHLRPGTILCSHPQIGESDFLQSAILLTRVDEVAGIVEGVILNQPWHPPGEHEGAEEDAEDHATEQFEKKLQAELDRRRAKKEAEAAAAVTAPAAPKTVDATATTIDITAEDLTTTPATADAMTAPTSAATTPAAATIGAVKSAVQDASLWSDLNDENRDADSIEAQRSKLGALIHRFSGTAMYGGPDHYDDNDVHRDFIVLHRRKDWALREFGLDSTEVDATNDGAHVKPASLKPLIPAELECTPEGVVREVTPPVFIGDEAHWAKALEWAMEPKMDTKWLNKANKFFGASPHTVADKTSTTVATPTTDAVTVAAAGSQLHSWDFLVYHGRVSWGLRELLSQLNAGDWFAYEGSAAHVFTGLVSPQQVDERARSLQRKARGERPRRAKKASRFRKRVSLKPKEIEEPPRGWDVVPFELLSSPSVSLRSYDAVVSQLTAASPTTPLDAVAMAATAHLPTVLFPQQRLWHHAMYQLQGDARHWAYLPRIGLDGGQHPDDDLDAEEDQDDADADEDDDRK